MLRNARVFEARCDSSRPNECDSKECCACAHSERKPILHEGRSLDWRDARWPGRAAEDLRLYRGRRNALARKSLVGKGWRKHRDGTLRSEMRRHRATSCGSDIRVDYSPSEVLRRWTLDSDSYERGRFALAAPRHADQS